MPTDRRPLALITGTDGLAADVVLLCAKGGYDLILASDSPLPEMAALIAGLGIDMEIHHLDLSDAANLGSLYERINRRGLDLLMVDARQGMDAELMQRVYRIGIAMRCTGRGCIVITGGDSTHPAVTQSAGHGTDLVTDGFLHCLRTELHNSGITYSSVMVNHAETALRPAQILGNHATLH